MDISVGIKNNNKLFFDFSNIEIPISEESETIDNNYDFDMIDFGDDSLLKNGKLSRSKLKKYELLENITKSVIENHIYDNLSMSFDYDKINKQNFSFLNIIQVTESKIKTFLTNSNIIKEHNEFFDNYINNYKTLKIIANYYGYRLVLYDINENILDNIIGNKKKILNFLFYEGNIYPLKYKPFKFLNVIPRLNNLIYEYKKRDIKRNLRYVLINELSAYKNHFIKYHHSGNFKYKYLIDEVNKKKVEDITDETIKICEYLINNFGIQFDIMENYLQVDKDMFNMDFVNKFNDYVIPNFSKFDYDILKNNEMLELRNYHYGNDKLRINIYGGTKEEIIKKGRDIDININDNEIRKILTNFNISDIQSDEDILIIKEIFKDNNFIYYRKKPEYELILATKKIDLDHTINSDYIIDLYNKEPINYCKMCNIDLNLNTMSIDAINPMFGHIQNNVQLLCLKCNVFKNIKFIGNYSQKPYYYDINTLLRDKLIELLKYHNLEISGITFTLRKRLEKFIKNIN
jgi:hypothetical protein